MERAVDITTWKAHVYWIEWQWLKNVYIIYVYVYIYIFLSTSMIPLNRRFALLTQLVVKRI